MGFQWLRRSKQITSYGQISRKYHEPADASRALSLQLNYLGTLDTTKYPSDRLQIHQNKHSLKLHWFADLMNVTEEVTIHRP